MLGINWADEQRSAFQVKRQDGTMKRGPSPSIQAMVQEALGHHQAGRLEEAEQLYRKILAIDPRHADALHLLGMVEYQAGRLEAAADLIRQAIAIHSKGASYYANLGTVLQAQGNLDEAEALYRQALALKPQLAEVHVNLANVLQAQGKLDESVLSYERALALKPDSAEAFNNLGTARQEQGEMDAAVACYERALAIKPDYAEVYYNLGNARRFQGKLDEAVIYYQRALTVKPEYPEAFYNMGNVLREQGKVDEALAQFARALELRPEYVQAGFGQSLAQLVNGDFAVGWKNFEKRWLTADHDTPRRDYAQPRWSGEKLTSGSLLIWGEQGIGDEIMFAGLIPDVIRTGDRCVLDCQERLKPLFARSFPGIDVVSGCGPGLHPELEIAAQLPCASLPGVFRNTSAVFAATTSPYLIADAAERDRLRASYADGRRLVGLAWYTNNRKWGSQRSIDLSLLASLFKRTDTQWISLQYGDHDGLESQVAEASAPIYIDRTVDQLADIDLFAAQVAAMDLVITIDNSTAHLAGALGVPVWVLLPFMPDWRWLLDREDCPWYPTMRLFRQPKIGDWESVVEKVEHALSVADRAPRPGKAISMSS
jgi:tetratricopeptide (TPR) repeat protein